MNNSFSSKRMHKIWEKIFRYIYSGKNELRYFKRGLLFGRSISCLVLTQTFMSAEHHYLEGGSSLLSLCLWKVEYFSSNYQEKVGGKLQNKKNL